MHQTGLPDPDHCGWYQATSDVNRAHHLRDGHWGTWRDDHTILSAQQHQDLHNETQLQG